MPESQETAMKAHAKSPKRILGQMLLGNQIQQAIYVAAKLGIADLLADGPRQSKDLAAATGAHAGALYRLLRTLASFGIFAEDEQKCFALTPLATPLQSETPDSMRVFALWSGSVSYQAFGGLEHSVLTGEPAFEDLFGMDFYTYLAQHADAGTLFDEMMARHTRSVGPLVANYDFSGINTVVDVGGGRGELLVAILKAHPSMRGVLFDKPHVIQGTNGLLKDADIARRCAAVAGDLMTSVPNNGDAYILKSVVHGMDDDTAVRVLKNCRMAMHDAAKLLLVEFVMPSGGNEPFPSKLMDLLMLVGCYGRERTEEEFRALFRAAGFRLTNMMTTRYAYSVIEGSIA